MVNWYLTDETRTYNGVKTAYSTNGVGKIGHAKKMKLDHFFISYTKISSKWIKELHIRLKNTKVLEENTGSKISDISHSNIFFWCIFLGRGNKIKKKQIGLYRTKKVLHSKGNHQQNENPLNGKTYLSMIHLITG